MSFYPHQRGSTSTNEKKMFRTYPGKLPALWHGEKLFKSLNIFCKNQIKCWIEVSHDCFYLRSKSGRGDELVVELSPTLSEVYQSKIPWIGVDDTTTPIIWWSLRPIRFSSCRETPVILFCKLHTYTHNSQDSYSADSIKSDSGCQKIL